MRYSLAALILSLSTLSVNAFASQNFYDCVAVDNPTLKMSLSGTKDHVGILLDDGKKIIGDEAKFAYYEGFDNKNFMLGGLKNYVKEVEGGGEYSGYVYVQGSLFSEAGVGQVALYRSYYRSEKDCGNQSQWFNCKRD